MGIGYVAGVLGGSILAHAAYATIQYRAVLKITEEEFSRPPMDVVMQLLLGLALCMWAGLAVPSKFLSVLPHSEENSKNQRKLHLPGSLVLAGSSVSVLQPSVQSPASQAAAAGTASRPPMRSLHPLEACLHNLKFCTTCMDLHHTSTSMEAFLPNLPRDASAPPQPGSSRSRLTWISLSSTTVEACCHRTQT
uniref:Uncharacterized protein n=1 Tax=Arundo donax TaxID=35708 RepID=A0A0A9EQY0_ARUDO